MRELSRSTSEGALAAASAGAVGGLTAMTVWELTAAPGVVASVAAAGAGLVVFATGSAIDRLLGHHPDEDT